MSMDHYRDVYVMLCYYMIKIIRYIYCVQSQLNSCRYMNDTKDDVMAWILFEIHMGRNRPQKG